MQEKTQHITYWSSVYNRALHILAAQSLHELLALFSGPCLQAQTIAQECACE